MKVLCVEEEAGRTASGCDPHFSGASTRLVYRFDNGLPPGGRRLEHVSPGEFQYAVPECSRALAARFDNFVLNLQFAEQLLNIRPDLALIRGVYGCTVDLIRIANLLGVAVCCEFPTRPNIEILDHDARTLLNDALDRTDFIIGSTEYRESLDGLPVDLTDKWFPSCPTISDVVGSRPDKRTLRIGDYALYEFAMRDYPLLLEMQRKHVEHFTSCRDILDLGCGAGIFLDQLQRIGLKARGVERNSAIAEYARGMGLDVITADALEFLAGTAEVYDGIYCSHFVEHLPFDAVCELFARIVPCLRAGGVLVMIFPDPESIRSQLLGFWRDLEHVRFYHPELIELLGRTHGLDCEWNSQRADPHTVVPFARHPPPLPNQETNIAAWSGGSAGRSHWEVLLGKLGLVTRNHHLQQLTHLEQHVQRIEAIMELQQQQIRNLAERTATLWQVNQTWAWEDNAVLRFRKPITDRS